MVHTVDNHQEAKTESAVDTLEPRSRESAREELAHSTTSQVTSEASIHGFPYLEAERLLVSIERMLLDGKTPVVLTHRMPDTDAAGAALAMQALIGEMSQELLGKRIVAPIYFEERPLLPLRKIGFEGQGMGELLAQREAEGENLAVVLVDAHDPNTPNVSGNVTPGRPIVPRIVVDHHDLDSPGQEKFIYLESDKISPNSASGIMFAALHLYFTPRGGFPETPEWKKTFTIMCAGVASDNHFHLEHTPGIGPSPRYRIFEALRALSDRDLLPRLVEVVGFEKALNVARSESRNLRADGTRLPKIAGQTVTLHSVGEVEDEAVGRPVIGAVADQLLEETRADINVTCTTFPARTGLEDEILLAISIRTHADVTDAGPICRKLFAPYGGGRAGAGGAQLSRKALADLNLDLDLPVSGGLTDKDLEKIYEYMAKKLA